MKVTPENNNKDIVRFATPDDAVELLKIYSPYVLKTAITFEYVVPTVEEFVLRMKNIQWKYPYLVAVSDGTISGYAYAGSFIGRAAYNWAVETTIYVEKSKRKQGIGRILYNALESILLEMNICNLYACIGYPEIEDEYLTRNSVLFHEHLGYTMIGKFYHCGYKFNRWYSMVWMEKIIAKHLENPSEVINVNERKSSFF